MQKARLHLLLLTLFPFLHVAAAPAPDTVWPVRTLGMNEGLPQSFVSGLVQDKQGFVWIGTRDGLARYDGRHCKVFNHVPGDSASLSGNIITNLYYDSRGLLWILYEAGGIDLLNTATETLEHLTDKPHYKAAQAALKGNFSTARSFAEDAEGRVWLPGREGLFVFDLARASLRFYGLPALGLSGNPVFGLARWGRNILLATDTAFVSLDGECRIRQVMPYRFSTPWLRSAVEYKDVCPVIRPNGDVVALDRDRLILYRPATGVFATIRLPPAIVRVYSSILQDEKGSILFDYDGFLYRLSPENKLELLSTQTVKYTQSQCMLLDRSGVWWVGGNGSGIRLYDRRLTHMRGQADRAGFTRDVMTQNLNVSAGQLKATFLHTVNNYRLRWAAAKDNTLWFAEAAEGPFTGRTCFFAGGRLRQQNWKLTGADADRAAVQNINALAFSRSGRLWGLDYSLRPLLFNPVTGVVAVYPKLPGSVQGVNSLVIDGEDLFWLGSASQGLFCFNRVTGDFRHYTNNQGEAFPSSLTSVLLQDPADSGKLWIGTLGSGLVHFDKKTGKAKIYTTADGLPNNTVYAVLSDAEGRLWGSTNKGIFRFDPRTKGIYSFTARDGLAGDEFNRFHFLSLPDGRMAFGGVDGYVVFDPLAVTEDDFDPEVALTDISINNKPAEYGRPGSPLGAAVNSLPGIGLEHRSNTLGFEFAALEYNVPGKIQYRYKLEGFDERWIETAHGNTAVYTNLPPGHYTLLVNATNTAGKWGGRIKQFGITIHPPFWKRGWFVLLCVLLVLGTAWWVIHRRISGVHRQARQQLQYERKAMELEAKALRAQMNPHFIFNCLNSIKDLIQEKKEEEAVVYLTTFAKLIRGQLANAQKETSLYEELETCRLYAQLETLRFGNKVTVRFTVEEGLDIHSIAVPPLLVQPFLENAIRHGVLPLENSGCVTVSVHSEAEGVACTVDDNGIGRKTSELNKTKTGRLHQSKGMQLTQERLVLHSRIHNHGSWAEVIDKSDERGGATGTRVVLHLKTNA